MRRHVRCASSRPDPSRPTYDTSHGVDRSQLPNIPSSRCENSLSQPTASSSDITQTRKTRRVSRRARGVSLSGPVRVRPDPIDRMCAARRARHATATPVATWSPRAYTSIVYTRTIQHCECRVPCTAVLYLVCSIGSSHTVGSCMCRADFAL